MRTPRRRPPSRPKASTLIITLLVIVILSTIVVAFMQSMAIERMVARSYANSFRAKLAAETALESSLKLIEKGIGTNRAYLVGQTNFPSGFGSVLLIGSNGLSDPRQLIPLISGNQNLLADFPTNSTNNFNQYLGARTNMNAAVTVDVNSRNESIQDDVASTIYRAPWVYLVDSSGVTNSRYAFFVIDEQSRINLRWHRTAPRHSGTNADEIASVLADGSSVSQLEMTNLTAGFANLVTADTARQSFTNVSVFHSKKHLFSMHSAIEEEVIPAGYYTNSLQVVSNFVAFADAGKPKYNINDLATNTAYGSTATARAENIATIINRNLPKFKERDHIFVRLSVGAQQTNYLNRIAASIVDYIDPNTVSTAVNGGEPAGKGLFPMMTALAERYEMTSFVQWSPTNDATCEFKSRVYAQFWNPYTQTITGQVQVKLFNRMLLKFGNAPQPNPLTTYNPPAVTLTIRPNEFSVVEFDPDSTTRTSSVSVPVSGSNRYAYIKGSSTETEDSTTWPYFEVTWNGQRSEMQRRLPSQLIGPEPPVGGLRRNDRSFDLLVPQYQVSLIPTYWGGAGINGTNSYRATGDPRMTYLGNYDWEIISSDSAYLNTSRWGGAQLNTPLAGFSSTSQNYELFWKELDFVRANPVVGNAPTSMSQDPYAASQSTIIWNTNVALNAPLYVRKGPMKSIGELGNIFDPVQLNNHGYVVRGGSSSDFSSDSAGRTFRVGQPEFAYPIGTAAENGGVSASPAPAPVFNFPGRRASDLLDIFTVASTNAFTNGTAYSGFPQTRGRLNINTATSNSLAALFCGIQPTSDGAFTNSKIDITNAYILANAVAMGRPYAGLGQLAGNTNVTAILAQAGTYTPKLGGGSTNQPSEVMDRAREEAFAAICNLVSVQSRAFRVYCIGESIKTKGGTQFSVGRSVSVAHIEIEPENISGVIKMVPKVKFVRYEN